MKEIINLIKNIFVLRKIIMIYFLITFLASILYTSYRYTSDNIYDVKLVFYNYSNLNTKLENDLNKLIRNININFNLNYIPHGNKFNLNTTYQNFRHEIKESVLIAYNNNVKSVDYSNRFNNILEKNLSLKNIEITKNRFEFNSNKDFFSISLRLKHKNDLSSDKIEKIILELNEESKIYLDNFLIYIEDIYNEELSYFKNNVLKNLYDYILVEQEDIYLDEIEHLSTELIKAKTINPEDYNINIAPCRAGIYCINYIMGEKYISKILELHIDKKTHFYVNSNSFRAIGILEEDMENFDILIDNLNNKIADTKMKHTLQEYFKLDDYKKLNYLNLYLNYLIIITFFGTIFLIIIHFIIKNFKNN